MLVRVRARALLLAAAAFAAGCAGPYPEQRVAPPAPAGDLQLVEAVQQLARHQGAAVRWGGTVLHSELGEDGTSRIVVLERQLDDQGRPIPGGQSDGRFVVRPPPAEGARAAAYARGTEITVRGSLAGTRSQRVGEAVVEVPLVHAETIHAWDALPGGYYPRGRYRHAGYYHGPYYHGPRLHFRYGFGHRLHFGHRHHHPFHHH